LVRTAVLVFLILLPHAVRADVGVSLRQVPVHITITADRDYPEFSFFLVQSEHNVVERVSPPAAGPVIAKSGDVGGSWFFSEVYAVPKAELVKFDGALPPTPWFGWKEEGHKYLAGHIHVRPILDVFDNRVRIEKSYRIQRVEDSFSVDLMSENQGNPWVKRAWSGLCCGLPALAISVSVVLAGLWVVRRGKRR